MLYHLQALYGVWLPDVTHPLSSSTSASGSEMTMGWIVKVVLVAQDQVEIQKHGIYGSIGVACILCTAGGHPCAQCKSRVQLCAHLV